MPLVTLPHSSRSLAFGHQVAELPALAQGPLLRIHTVEPGATATWTGHANAPVLLVLEGLGKLAVDGTSQRFAGPCVLGVPGDAELMVTNQGTWPMRIVEWSQAVAPSS